ncbi:MAG: hypothetical protein M3R25_09835 [Bacteroidota bacterium]|nr:hypothetical protein [Bacteroidota bacterium]
MTASIVRSYLIITLLIFFSLPILAQVQVRDEPFHKPVLENEYFRLLDVWIQPGDTSLFHIHSTPSLFLYLSDTKVCVEEKGKAWISDITKTGYSWYRSFDPDTVVHRVANCDTVPLHVTDIEILSSYNVDQLKDIQPLDIPLKYNNEKAFAYTLSSSDLKKTIQTRGPMIAELAKGNTVYYDNVTNQRAKSLTQGKYVYIDPGTTFYFTTNDTGAIEIVLFEIK